MQNVKTAVNTLNAGAQTLTANDEALKSSGAQLSGLGTQLSQGVNGMSTLFTQMEEQLPVMLEGVEQAAGRF